MFNNEANYLISGQYLNALMEYLQDQPLKESMNFFLAARNSQELTVEFVASLLASGTIDEKEFEKTLKDLKEEVKNSKTKKDEVK